MKKSINYKVLNLVKHYKNGISKYVNLIQIWHTKIFQSKT